MQLLLLTYLTLWWSCRIPGVVSLWYCCEGCSPLDWGETETPTAQVSSVHKHLPPSLRVRETLRNICMKYVIPVVFHPVTESILQQKAAHFYMLETRPETIKKLLSVKLGGGCSPRILLPLSLLWSSSLRKDLCIGKNKSNLSQGQEMRAPLCFTLSSRLVRAKCFYV